MDERAQGIESFFLKTNDTNRNGDEVIELVKQRADIRRLLNGQSMSAEDLEVLFLRLQEKALGQMWFIQRITLEADINELDKQFRKNNDGKSFLDGARENLGDEVFKIVERVSELREMNRLAEKKQAGKMRSDMEFNNALKSIKPFFEMCMSGEIKCKTTQGKVLQPENISMASFRRAYDLWQSVRKGAHGEAMLNKVFKYLKNSLS